MKRENSDHSIRFRLRTKFMVGIVILESILMGAIILVVEHQMRQSVLDEFLKRATAITRNLAAVNNNYVATYNYVSIGQNTRQVVEENGLLYAAVIFYDGEVASYIGPDHLKQRVTEGPLYDQSLMIRQDMIQYGQAGEKEFCDIAVPIFLKEENWGTVRGGFSLNDIRSAILRTRQLLLGLGLMGLVLGCIGSVILARRITSPISILVRSVEAVSQGDYAHPICVKTHDEIAYLGRRFVAMQEIVKEHIRLLTENNETITATNEQLALEIVERKRTEEALRKAMQAAEAASIAKTHFLNNVSHELRTPLNGILGMAELLLATDLSPKQQRLATDLYSSGEGFLGIINNILDFSGIESGKLRLCHADFDLLRSVEETITFLAGGAHEKKLEMVSLVYHDVPLRLKGDPGRLNQILQILIGNAIKFTEQGGVTVNVRRITEGDKDVLIRFEVSDTGIGVCPEIRESVFALFSQADESLTRQHEGLGLGLAIAAQLAALMGGEIGLEGESGKGATFWFTARFEKQGPGESPDARAQKSLKSLRILVSVSPESVRAAVLYHLANWGIRFQEAEQGQQVPEHLQQAASEKDPFHMALLDLTGTGTDALGIIRRIRSHPATTDVRPVLLEADGHDDGPSGFAVLRKPVLQSELYRLLVSSGRMAETDAPARPGQHPGRFDARVLLVEDNPVNLELTRQKLKIMGCSVDEARNGKEAVDAFDKQEYDIIAMDCQMPVMDGYEATRAIREIEKSRNPQTSHTPIFALTAHAMSGDRQRCLNAGMDDYLAKPFNLNQLGEILKRWLPPADIRETAASDIRQ